MLYSLSKRLLRIRIDFAAVSINVCGIYVMKISFYDCCYNMTKTELFFRFDYHNVNYHNVN